MPRIQRRLREHIKEQFPQYKDMMEKISEVMQLGRAIPQKLSFDHTSIDFIRVVRNLPVDKANTFAVPGQLLNALRTNNRCTT